MSENNPVVVKDAVVVKPLETGMLGAVKELIAEAVLEFYGNLEFLPGTREGLLRHYEETGYLGDLDDHGREYAPENGMFLVLMKGEEVAGCGGLRRINREDGELVRMWLRKGERRQGYGRMLFETLMQAAQGLGYAKVYLDTSARCLDALRLFRRNGFADCPKYKESIGDIFLCRTIGA